MTLRLTYFGETTIPVEVEGLTPDWACDKSLTEIERFEIFHGNQTIPLAEMFRVSGDASDKSLEFEGSLSTVHWIGSKMSSGQILIQGSAGRHVGSEMSGGQIVVEGDVGGWAGVEMHGGFIHVNGNAGPLVGGAYRGSARGMTGGTICINGNAGNEVGLAMRRGVIAIGGSAGDMLGFNMIAGSVLVFGQCGIRPGAGMRRGTLGLFGPNPPQLLSSFRYASTYRPQVIPLMLRTIAGFGFPVDQSLAQADYDLYHGDLLALGRGEVFLRHSSKA